MEYGLLGAAQSQMNEAMKGLDVSAQEEAQRNVTNKEISEQQKAAKSQLGATAGGLAGAAAGAELGASYGSEGGPWGMAIGGVIGSLAGYFGAKL